MQNKDFNKMANLILIIWNSKYSELLKKNIFITIVLSYKLIKNNMGTI